MITSIPISKLQKGSKRVFKELFLQYFELLHRYALHFVGDNSLAEEFVQDAFLVLWENRKKLKNTENIKAWLFTCIHNHALNYLRHQKIVQEHRNYEKHTGSVFENTTEPDPFLRESLNNAINKLPNRTKQIFVLSRLQKYRHKEIAEQLGISDKTVEVQIRKARLFLQDELKDVYNEL